MSYLKVSPCQVIEIDHGKLSYVGDHTQYEQTSEFYKSFLANIAEKEEPKEEEPIPRKESVGS